MWNAVELCAVKYEKLNLNIAIDALADSIGNMVDKDIEKLNLSNGNKKRLIKCKNELIIYGYEKSYKAIYSLIKINGLSLNAFKRTIRTKNYGENSYYYINYKYLDHIVEKLLYFILIIDKSILVNLLDYSKHHFYTNDCVTFRFIPIRKSLIEIEVDKYKNGLKSAIKLPYFKNRIKKLNDRLNEVNLRWESNI